MRLVDLDGRRVVIWGAGREGRAVIGALKRLDVVTDIAVVDDAATGEESIDDVPVFRGSDKGALLESAEVVVRSPSISRYRADVVELQRRGIEFTTATRLWFAEGRDNVIGVTGTKGKSTTASLVACLVRASGKTVALAGNIGRAPIDLFGSPEPDWWVVELSSYQTSDLDVSPSIGVLSSLSPEHLDWHGDEATYFRDKLNLFAHGCKTIVCNWADTGVRAHASQLHGRVIRANEQTIHVGDGKVITEGETSLSAPKLLGTHNRLLTHLALTTVEAAGIDVDANRDALAEALSDFEPLPHRLQIVADVDGVTYVDDSISTTPAATIAALSAFEGRRITVLVGGYDRGLSYDEFASFVVDADHRIRVVTLPQSGERISSALRRAGLDGSLVESAASLDEAVHIAARGITDVVLLSPGAPSFGLFRDYIERAEVFRRAVERNRS